MIFPEARFCKEMVLVNKRYRTKCVKVLLAGVVQQDAGSGRGAGRGYWGIHLHLLPTIRHLHNNSKIIRNCAFN